MEVLEHSPGATRRGTLWVLVAAIAVLAVIVGALWLDSFQRDRETQALETTYAQAITTIETAEARVRGTVAYSSPLLQTGPPQVRADLELLVLEEVSRGTADVRQARQLLADITVWPWHDDIGQQRDDLLAAIDERSSALTNATGQGLVSRSSN